jgi:hypothetical protein
MQKAFGFRARLVVLLGQTVGESACSLGRLPARPRWRGQTREARALQRPNLRGRSRSGREARSRSRARAECRERRGPRPIAPPPGGGRSGSDASAVGPPSTRLPPGRVRRRTRALSPGERRGPLKRAHSDTERGYRAMEATGIPNNRHKVEEELPRSKRREPGNQLRSGAGVEPTQRGATTPHRF